MASRQDRTEKKEEQQQQSHGRAAMSPQEAQQYRATAQQNSIDAIRAAEERYAKAKQSGSAALYNTKDAVVHGLGATTTYLAGKGSQAAGYTAEVGKDAAFTAGQKAADLANQAAVKTKDASLSAGGYAAEKGKQGYEAARDTTFAAGQKAAELAKQAAVKTKDTSLSAAGYGAAKDGKKTGETATAKTGKAEETLGEQREGIKGEEETKGRRKGYEKTTTEEKGETGGEDAGERIVVKELEPEIEIEAAGGEHSKSGGGGIFETVGAAVIQAAETAKEAVFGKEKRREG